MFHAHLDNCTRCYDRPFDLCGTGARLLRATCPEPETFERQVLDYNNRKLSHNDVHGRGL